MSRILEELFSSSQTSPGDSQGAESMGVATPDPVWGTGSKGLEFFSEQDPTLEGWLTLFSPDDTVTAEATYSIPFSLEHPSPQLSTERIDSAQGVFLSAPDRSPSGGHNVLNQTHDLAENYINIGSTAESSTSTGRGIPSDTQPLEVCLVILISSLAPNFRFRHVCTADIS
jgi:hypothetical protein